MNKEFIINKLNIILDPKNFEIFIERFLKTKYDAIKNLTPQDYYYNIYRVHTRKHRKFFKNYYEIIEISPDEYLLNYVDILKYSYIYPNSEAYKLYDFYESSNPPFNSISIPVEVYNYMLSTNL